MIDCTPVRMLIADIHQVLIVTVYLFTSCLLFFIFLERVQLSLAQPKTVKQSCSLVHVFFFTCASFQVEFSPILQCITAAVTRVCYRENYSICNILCSSTKYKHLPLNLTSACGMVVVLVSRQVRFVSTSMLFPLKLLG